MKKIVLSLIAIGIVLLSILATPAGALWPTYPAMYGALWDNPGDFTLRHQGIYGDTYVSRQSTNGTIYKEFVAILDWGIEWPYFEYYAWVSVGYYHYKSNTPQQFVRWRAGEGDIVHTTYHGYVSYDRYQDYFIWKDGDYWEAFIGGGQAEEIYLPSYDESAIHAEMSSTRDTGDLYGYWRYMQEFHNGYWTYWDWQTPASNKYVVVYILNQHTWGCYNSRP